MTVRFDGYSATTTEATHHVLASLLLERGGEVSQGRGFHTFGERLAVKDDTGIEVGSVMWGGRQGSRCMIEVKGERTPEVVERLRSRFKHRCTRVDSCADFDAPGAFDRLLGACVEVKKRYRLKGERQGDWEDFPELGRTQYLGARDSVTRLRLYEKGKQPEYRHLDRPEWVRAELQVRPAKDAKGVFAELDPCQVWGASRWSKDLAVEILAQHVDPHPAGTTYRETERDRALKWMVRQYGVHLVSLAGDLGGWECVGKTLQEMIAESVAERRS